MIWLPFGQGQLTKANEESLRLGLGFKVCTICKYKEEVTQPCRVTPAFTHAKRKNSMQVDMRLYAFFWLRKVHLEPIFTPGTLCLTIYHPWIHL